MYIYIYIDVVVDWSSGQGHMLWCPGLRFVTKRDSKPFLWYGSTVYSNPQIHRTVFTRLPGFVFDISSCSTFLYIFLGSYIFYCEYTYRPYRYIHWARSMDRIFRNCHFAPLSLQVALISSAGLNGCGTLWLLGCSGCFMMDTLW